MRNWEYSPTRTCARRVQNSTVIKTPLAFRITWTGVLLALLWGATCGCVRSNREPYGKPKRWSLPVDSTCSVGDIAPLFANASRAPWGTLVLKHRLCFDGRKYVSQCYVPLLEAHCIPVHANLYRVISPWGDDLIMRVNKYQQGWVLNQLSDGRMLLRATIGARSALYSRGNVTRITCDGEVYDVVHHGSGAVDLTTSLGVCVFTSLYDQYTRTVVCRNGTDTAKLQIDTQGRIDGGVIGGHRLRIEYDGGLITLLSLDEEQRILRWAMPTDHAGRGRPVPVAPVIVDDGIWRYAATIYSTRMRVEFEGKDVGSRGAWEVDFRTYETHFLRNVGPASSAMGNRQ